MSTPKRRAILFNVAILLLSTSASFTLTEIAIRAFDIGPEISPVWKDNYMLSENPTLRYELKPLSKDGEFTINKDGMRDDDYPIQQPSNSFRIAVVGDSIAYGRGVEQDESFSFYLEKLLNQYFAEYAGHIFEVLNFGVTGYSFTQNIENLRVKGLKYEPDLILYAYCLNDPQEYSLEMAHLLAEMTEARKDYGRALEGAEGILRHSRIYLLTRYLIYSNLQRKEHPTWDKDDPQFVSMLEGTYVEYFTSIHQLPRTWNPIADGLDYLQYLSTSQNLPTHMIIFPILRDLENYGLHHVHDQLKDAFAKRGIHSLDLHGVYLSYEKETQEKVRRDSLHPNEEGHEFTAVAILRYLLHTNSILNLRAADFLRVVHGSEPEARYAKLLERESLAEIRE